MPDLHPFFDLGGPLCDHRHAGEPAPPLQALDPTSTPPTPRFRRASQIDPWIVNRLIDRLGTQVAWGWSGKRRRSSFGTPPLAQQLGDHIIERFVTCQAPRARRPGSPLGAQPLRRRRQVAATTVGVAAKLS
jgi:hypothetical protein